MYLQIIYILFGCFYIFGNYCTLSDCIGNMVALRSAVCINADQVQITEAADTFVLKHLTCAIGADVLTAL